MPPKDTQVLPFLTRDMLAFQHGTAFSLEISTRSNTAANITLRGFTREGPFTFRVLTTATGALDQQRFRIPDIPIMISVIDTDLALYDGDCYASVTLVIDGEVVQNLCAGQVFGRIGPAWPAQNLQMPRPNSGALRSVAGANPAAGAECTITVPTGRTWHVLGFNVRLITDGNAANRRVHVKFNIASNGVWEAFSLIDQTATTTIDYRCAHFGTITDETDNGVTLIPMPGDIWLNSGDTISTVTTNKQATDDYGIPYALVEEFWVGY